MYSRDFSDRRQDLPPHYGGTALLREKPCKSDQANEGDPPPPTREQEDCREGPPPPPHEKQEDGGCREGRPPAFIGRLLPPGIEGNDLLLLALALLLLLDGCEDEALPLLLLFLLIVH